MGLKEAKPQIICKILKNRVGTSVILFIFGSVCLGFLPFPRIARHSNEIVWEGNIIKHPSATSCCTYYSSKIQNYNLSP